MGSNNFFFAKSWWVQPLSKIPGVGWGGGSDPPQLPPTLKTLDYCMIKV